MNNMRKLNDRSGYVWNGFKWGQVHLRAQDFMINKLQVKNKIEITQIHGKK